MLESTLLLLLHHVLAYCDLVAQLAGLQMAVVAQGHALPNVACVLLALLHM